jgi:hypothetical protein
MRLWLSPNHKKTYTFKNEVDSGLNKDETDNVRIKASLTRVRVSIVAEKSVICSECVSVALVSQHSLRMRHVIFIICGLSGCTIFPTLSQKKARFLGKIYGT